MNLMDKELLVAPKNFAINRSAMENTTVLIIEDSLEIQTLLEYNFRNAGYNVACLLYTSPSPRDREKSRMPSSA